MAKTPALFLAAVQVSLIPSGVAILAELANTDMLLDQSPKQGITQ